MKFYVAGKFQDRENVRKLMDKIEAYGHTISTDWTDHINNSGKAKSEYAIYDLNGVKDCEVFVGRFVDDFNYSGARVEFGIALGLGKVICIIGRAIDSCIFMNHPVIRKFESEGQFVSIIGEFD